MKHHASSPVDWTRVGLFLWGLFLIILGGVVLAIVFFADPKKESGLYLRVKDFSSLLGPIFGASALAWSWFYQTRQREKREQTGETQSASQPLDKA